MSANRKPLHPLGYAGYLVMLAGYVAWAWTGEWRWGLTGVLAFLALAALNGYLKRRRTATMTQAQTALQHLADDNKASARFALERLSVNELWAVCEASSGLTDLASDLFAQRAQEHAVDQGEKP